jgi:hypothetical protein
MKEAGWIAEYRKAERDFRNAKATLKRYFVNLVQNLLIQDNEFEAIAAMERCPDKDIKNILAEMINKS